MKQPENFSTDCSFHFVDMLPVFSKVNPNGKDWWVLDWDAHPNEDGHDLIAKALSVITKTQLFFGSTQANPPSSP
jgi:hypothetical protein